MNNNNIFHFRPIQQSDNAVLANLVRSVLAEFKANKPGTVYYDPSTDDLHKLFNIDGAAYWVVEKDNKILGGGGVYPTQNLPNGCCELVKLYLLPEGRGAGLGKQLIERCIETAKNLGYKQMYLETMPELSTAMGLYEKLGFRYLDGPLGSSGHYGCSLWMLRDL